MLANLFKTFPPADLLDADFHKYLYEAIKEEQYIASRVKMAEVLGEYVIAPLIK